MMKNIFSPTNIETALGETKATTVNTSDVANLLKGITPQHQSVNNFNFDALETDRIYHIDTIKKVCVDYRLRFLDSKYFKGKVPQEAFDKIEALENEHHTKLDHFKIMAPSVLFVLERTDDPLLFVPLGNDYFYLIHKWGTDLHPFRKALVWPFRSLLNLSLTVLLISYALTLITPMSLFTRTPDATSFWLLFFFMFKSIASVVLFVGFALGKNFNPAIWNSKYNKT